MASFSRIFISRFLSLIPLLILLFLSFSETDFNFEKLSFLSFNLIYIVIFYWVLKKPDILGYGFIFLAGIVNDVIIGLPIGVSPITYLILAGFAAYIRYLTVQPSLIYDWIIFAADKTNIRLVINLFLLTPKASRSNIFFLDNYIG